MKGVTCLQTLNINGRLLDLDEPKVMGILNVTPDSFYDESRSFSETEIRGRIEQMINEGVDIIDIGGCSTRPGFAAPSEDEELKRVSKGCRLVREISSDIPLSVDTYRPNVAKQVISRWNVNIVNDVYGILNPDMWNLVASEKIAYVLTHNLELPISDSLQYTAEVVVGFAKALNELYRLGINDVILDPGFGFSKTQDQNFQLLDNLNEICDIGCPVMVGISRKSMIHKTLDCSPSESLFGSVALDAIALEKGARIIRVHDVKPAKETVKLFNKIKNKT